MCKIFVGGIVGINYRPTDDGPHIYEDCANRAEIGFATTDNAFKVLPSFTGGILGYTEHPVEVRNCEGAAYINVNNANAKENGIFTATGGIVGAVKGTAALIEKCHVTADMRHYQYNNTWDDPLSAANGGGIVGCALGADEANRIAITGCSCSGMVESKRSGAAGIVGYARSRISPTAVSRAESREAAPTSQAVSPERWRTRRLRAVRSKPRISMATMRRAPR